MDRKMLLTFYRFSNEHVLFEKANILLSRVSPYIFFIIYVSVAGFLAYGASKKIILFISVPFINLIISQCIRAVVKRERPYKALNLYVLPKKKSYSMPSNHSSSATIIAFACLTVNEWLGLAVFILAIFTGISRIFAALHYPSDVLIGFLQSAVIAIIGFNLVPKLFML